MDASSWFKQSKDKPLYPDLLWSRPENKRQAGKLLIIGGNKFGFAVPAAAYGAALKAGIGSCRALLPESLRKTVGTLIEADFAPSNPSGSFAKDSLAGFLENSSWADGVLLSGNFGRNSETAIVLDEFTQKYPGQLVIAEDGLDYFINAGSQVLNRDKTTLVINLGKLQKLAKNTNPEIVIRHQDSLAEIVRKLSDWSQTAKARFVTRHEKSLIIAVDGKVSTTLWDEDQKWQVELPAYLSVWQIQQPTKAFEALTSSVYSFLSDNSE